MNPNLANELGHHQAYRPRGDVCDQTGEVLTDETTGRDSVGEMVKKRWVYETVVEEEIT